MLQAEGPRLGCVPALRECAPTLGEVGEKGPALLPEYVEPLPPPLSELLMELTQTARVSCAQAWGLGGPRDG